MNSTNRFKNSSGMFLTQALFLEMSYKDRSQVLYTLKDEDHDGYPSLYRLYMETADPTEWKFANAHLGGWKHWEILCAAPFFKEYLDRWRKELELKIKSDALARIMIVGKSGSKEAFTANRFIVEKGWEPKDSQGRRGRPSKEDIRKAAEDHLQVTTRLDQDYERIFSSKMN